MNLRLPLPSAYAPTQSVGAAVAPPAKKTSIGQGSYLAAIERTHAEVGRPPPRALLEQVERGAEELIAALAPQEGRHRLDDLELERESDRGAHVTELLEHLGGALKGVSEGHRAVHRADEDGRVPPPQQVGGSAHRGRAGLAVGAPRGVELHQQRVVREFFATAR